MYVWVCVWQEKEEDIYNTVQDLREQVDNLRLAMMDNEQSGNLDASQSIQNQLDEAELHLFHVTEQRNKQHQGLVQKYTV